MFDATNYVKVPVSVMYHHLFVDIFEERVRRR